MGGGGVHGVGSGGARGTRCTLGPEMGCRPCPSARVIQGASALALSDPSKMKAPPQAVRPWQRLWAKQVVPAGPSGLQDPVGHSVSPLLSPNRCCCA